MLHKRCRGNWMIPTGTLCPSCLVLFISAHGARIVRIAALRSCSIVTNGFSKLIYKTKRVLQTIGHTGSVSLQDDARKSGTWVFMYRAFHGKTPYSKYATFGFKPQSPIPASTTRQIKTLRVRFPTFNSFRVSGIYTQILQQLSHVYAKMSVPRVSDIRVDPQTV